MGGRGPAPKPADQRRRHNAPQRGEWVDLPAVTVSILPDLPAREDGRRWNVRTVVAWDAWRRDPATTQYGPAEVAAAVELAWLHDEYVRGGRDAKAAEVRLRMDGLGLTAKGKRDLRWRSPAETSTTTSPRRTSNVRRIRAFDPQLVAVPKPPDDGKDPA